MKHPEYDVIVVGAGHAGVEAAHAAHRLGAKVALITLTPEGVGVMSCNPAIGGLGKGHLVREIDALDGVMGRAADYAGIQFRLLNRRKGPAVRGPRAQADRKRYRESNNTELQRAHNIELLFGEVVDLIQNQNSVVGVLLGDGSEVKGRTVVLTTGTFLRGVIHIGDVQTASGRWQERPAKKLGERLEGMGLPLGRLKTGTPPRLDGRTIDWTQLEMQQGDETPELFSFMSKDVAARQISCGITHTNAQTHAIIRDNLERSAMYGGHIDGVGPRYCPSIEDKIVRFGDKESHQVFLEPEGLDDHTVYPNGISTSLPFDVQESYVRSIVGLSDVKILQPGYAIEYDYVDPRSLDRTLQLISSPGLYLAGQVNGTTGYEEAGAQGLVAGLNAALSALNRERVVFDRTNSYIGVLVDDLITRGVNEPYRMFTSRAEYRLSLRADNADQRLTPTGIGIGCVSDMRRSLFEKKASKLSDLTSNLKTPKYTPKQLNGMGFRVKEDGQRRSLYDLLAFPDVGIGDVVNIRSDVTEFGAEILQQVSFDALYANYVQRQKIEVEVLNRDEGFLIPRDLEFKDIGGLSNEMVEKLSKVRPETLGQALRIEGVTPAAATLILAKIKHHEKSRKSA